VTANIAGSERDQKRHRRYGAEKDPEIGMSGNGMWIALLLTTGITTPGSEETHEL